MMTDDAPVQAIHPAPPRPISAKACFDPDESVAALVLRHLPDVRDRLSLGCVSRVFKEVAATEGCWGTAGFDSLVLDGPLAFKLNDRRVSKLLWYAGRNLVSLTVNDVHVGFKGVGLDRDFWRCNPDDIWELGTGPGGEGFLKLQVLDLSRCSGVEGHIVCAILRRDVIGGRPNEERLDRLRLEGCKVSSQQLRQLDECVRHKRDPSEAFSKGPFDLWSCEHCGEVIDHGYQCVFCNSVACVNCAPQLPEMCSSCDAHVCLLPGCRYHELGEDFVEAEFEYTYACENCDERFCDDCTVTCTGSKNAEGCYKAWCDDCLRKDGIYLTCCSGGCNGCWCDECVPDTILQCTGIENYGGCDECICVECNRQHPALHDCETWEEKISDRVLKGLHITQCDGREPDDNDWCETSWCNKCAEWWRENFTRFPSLEEGGLDRVLCEDCTRKEKGIEDSQD